MTPERWARVQEVFGAALALGAEARVPYVERECSGDAELRREVESLLASHEEVSSAFLEPRTLATPRTLARLSGERRSVAPGARLGPYEIGETLGAGGMGEVFRARDTRLERDVAVKVLSSSLSSDREALARFEREAKAVAALSHPNILAIHDFGTQDGVSYAVMELLQGRTLREVLEAGAIPQPEAIELAIQLAKGLAAAHDHGIVHRDLKPENIFVTADGHLKILDFGLAKRQEPVARPAGELGAPTVPEKTRPGTVMGTVGYMSPEQVRGQDVDHRSDIFSFGAILYEMLSGRRAFKRDTAGDAMAAILRDEPPELSVSCGTISPTLEGVVRGCLEKERDERFQSTREIVSALSGVPPSASAGLSGERRRTIDRATVGKRARVALGLVLVAAVAVGGGAWLWRRSERTRWARNTAIPKIARLVEAEDFVSAAELARRARAVLPNDATLEKLWKNSTAEVSIVSDPTGAEVSVRPYAGDQDEWEALGTTPLKKVRVAAGPLFWRVAKPGRAPNFFIGQLLAGQSWDDTEKLYPAGRVPAEMVVVSGGETGLSYPHLEAPKVAIPDFLIDRTEVTNKDYKKFVDAGGYRKKDYWKQPFERDGYTLTWGEAVGRFLDATGRPGPATWQAGSFPPGMENHPVAGVSWYEAVAYADFVQKTLPTAYHWVLASELSYAGQIVPGSNFSGSGTRPVGTLKGLSGFGTTDMAGNVKEWCWNATSDGRRITSGGGFGEPAYMFVQPHAQSPWDRRNNFGFRCMKNLDSTAPSTSMATLDPRYRDFLAQKPASDETFQIYRGLYDYDRAPLDTKLVGTSTTDDWQHDEVSFAAAYGGERVPAHLFLPKNASPPYQVVVYFPGGEAIFPEKFAPSAIGDIDFLLKSGRALMFPIYRSTFERKDEYKVSSGMTHPTMWRDHVLMWSKDVKRSLDYLQSRPDIDASRMAFFGFSWGGGLGPIFLAVEDRFKAAVLQSGGFFLGQRLPEVDQVNLVGHVRTPVLMLSERYDDFFPSEATQVPLFRLIGTPDKDKRRVVYDTGHANAPYLEIVRETLTWLDKYLGPINPR